MIIITAFCKQEAVLLKVSLAKHASSRYNNNVV